MKNRLLYLSKKNPSFNPLCVSFITNIQLLFTTWLTNSTFHNGIICVHHYVQHSQAMLERGVFELAHLFFHCSYEGICTIYHLL